MVMKTFFVLFVLALAVGFYGQPAQANLVTNGSFEDITGFVPDYRDTMILYGGSATIPGWTVTGNQIGWIGPTNPFGLTAAQGSYFLDLTGDAQGSPFGGVQQTINTVSGQSYVLSFELGSSTTYGTPDAITASAGLTSAIFTSTLSSPNAWELGTMVFTASGSTTLISLAGSEGSNYIGLDTVSVTAVPIPAAGWLLGSGLMGLGLLRFRRKA
jgi:hypothetical protein